MSAGARSRRCAGGCATASGARPSRSAYGELSQFGEGVVKAIFERFDADVDDAPRSRR